MIFTSFASTIFNSTHSFLLYKYYLLYTFVYEQCPDSIINPSIPSRTTTAKEIQPATAAATAKVITASIQNGLLRFYLSPGPAPSTDTMGRRNNSSSKKKKNKSSAAADIEEPSTLLIYRPYGARYRHLHTSVYSITATEESRSRFDAESNLTRKEASALRKKIIKAHSNDPLGTSYSSSTTENTAAAEGLPDIPVYSKPSSKHFIFGSKEVYKTSPERLTTKIETALYSYKNPLIPLASVDAPMFKPCILTIGTYRMVFRRWSKSWRKPRGFTAENGNYYYWSWDLNDANNDGKKVVKSVVKLHKRTATLYKNEGDVVSAVAWLRPAVGLRKGMKVGKVGKSGEMVGDGRVGKMWRRGYVLKVSGKVREAEAVVTALVMLDEVWHPSVRGMGGKEVDGTKG